MARLKRIVSKVIRNAAARAAGMESIDPPLDFGHALTFAVYQAAVVDARAKQAAYNTLLSQVDEARLVFEAAEAGVGELSARMLAATFAKFGRDSNEYEKAGGTRKPARRQRKSPPATEPVPVPTHQESAAESAPVPIAPPLVATAVARAVCPRLSIQDGEADRPTLCNVVPGGRNGFWFRGSKGESDGAESRSATMLGERECSRSASSLPATFDPGG